MIKVMKTALAGLLVCALALVGLTACGSGAADNHGEVENAIENGSAENSNSEDSGDQNNSDQNNSAENSNSEDSGNENNNNADNNTGVADGTESAQDGQVDFARLQSENPDVFAWLYVPGTDIDMPIVQSGIADDYYDSHTIDGQEGAAGAAYTEMANLMNMCDFNTIIHGKDGTEGDLFYQLHRFENPDFFAEHDRFYIYLPENVLTYQIFTAYYDEDSDILRRFDYTTFAGCQSYLEQVYGARGVGRNLRDGWDDLTPHHFLVTLDGETNEDTQNQYVVIGALIEDRAGTIDRSIFD